MAMFESLAVDLSQVASSRSALVLTHLSMIEMRRKEESSCDNPHPRTLRGERELPLAPGPSRVIMGADV